MAMQSRKLLYYMFLVAFHGYGLTAVFTGKYNMAKWLGCAIHGKPDDLGAKASVEKKWWMEEELPKLDLKGLKYIVEKPLLRGALISRRAVENPLDACG